MAETHDIGRLFWHVMEYPTRKAPLVERGDTQEISYPFRKGFSLVVRSPGSRRAIVFGVWGAPQDETVALSSALRLGEKRNRSAQKEEDVFTKLTQQGA